MKLEFAKNLRELRLHRDLTQDELAEQLGVSVQTVSRWESSTKTSYPDIELLPAIAGFFGVTVDELLGCSKAQSDERLAKYWEEVDSYYHRNERFPTLKKMHEDYPDDLEIMFNLCEAGAFHPGILHADGTATLVKECALRILAESTNKYYRERATVALMIVEDEENISEVLEKYASESDMSKNKLLEYRYHPVRMPERIDKYYEISQRNILDEIHHAMTKLNMRKFEHKDDPEYNLWVYETILKLINQLSMSYGSFVCGDGEIDLWASRRIICGTNYAKTLCRIGKDEQALEILEEITAYSEKLFSIPEGTILTYRCPSLDLLQAPIKHEICGIQDIEDENETVIYVSTVTATIEGIIEERPTSIFFSPLGKYKFFRTASEKGLFTSICDTDRYKAIVERFRVMAEIFAKEVK